MFVNSNKPEFLLQVRASGEDGKDIKSWHKIKEKESS